jgi:hypothetical protein
MTEHGTAWLLHFDCHGLPRNEEVEEELIREMQEWNLTQARSVKAVQILCRPDDLWKKTRGLLMVSFKTLEEYEETIHEGIFIYGECCRTMPYRLCCTSVNETHNP